MNSNRVNKYKGGFEPLVAADLEARCIPFVYESVRIHYSSSHVYTPDFTLPNGVIIEAKGYFSAQDRSKMLKVRDQTPTADIRFLFQRAANKIYKGSKTTYAMWAEKHGFKWAEGTVPQAWIDEPKGVD